MKDRTIRKKYLDFQYYEIDAIKDYLEKMASDGWRLKDITDYFVFEKAEPQKLFYAVEIFGNSSIFNKKPDAKTRENIASYEQAGWKYVASSGMMHIFVNDIETTDALQINDLTKYRAIKKGVLKKNSVNWFFVTELLLFNTFLSLSSFETFITSNLSMFSAILVLFLIAYILGQVSEFLVWSIASRRLLTEGKEIEYLSGKDIGKRTLYKLLPLAILLIATFAFAIVLGILGDSHSFWTMLLLLTLIFAIIPVSHYIRKKSISRASEVISRIAIIIAISMFFTILTVFAVYAMGELDSDSQPILTMQDFGIVSAKYTGSEYTSKSIFAEKIDSYLTADEGDPDSETFLSYSTFRSSYPFIIRQYVKSTIRRGKWVYTETADPSWGADKVYISDFDFKMIVVYENCVFIYSTDNDLADGSKIKIAEKLDLAR